MMEVIERNEPLAPSEKQMREMKNGEVCYVPRHRHYVLRIGHEDYESKFLVLDDHRIKVYFGECPTTVRELYPGESITIKFS